MKTFRQLFFIFLALFYTQNALWSQDSVETSRDSEACIACHQNIHPGIVADWQRSRHAETSVSLALTRPGRERRVSVSSVPPGVNGDTAVGCYECHSLNSDRHADSFYHYGYEISVVISPNDCSTCHPAEASQYRGSKKAEAVLNLRKNPVYMALVNAVTGMKRVSNGSVHAEPASESAEEESCFACHGTNVEVAGMRTVESTFGSVKVPRLRGWPNQGVGRLNPDGSMGSCTACHPRHSMSIETARKPATCGQCHLEPDVPAYNVYKESKHGNIYQSEGDTWNFSEVPWKPGVDFKAPTCASCHTSLLTGPKGNTIVERSHDFADRLWVRIFGLIYSHPQPKSGGTYTIKNSDGLPLPVTFSGETADRYLIDSKEQELRKERMGRVCTSCHSTSWTSGHFDRFHKTAAEADDMVEAATLIMNRVWDNKAAGRDNLFDELPELYWVRQWLFYANSLRYASAMMGPDYAAFKNGYWHLNLNLKQLEQFLD